MTAESLTSALDFCVQHRLDLDFVYTLEQRGLVEIVRVEQAVYLPTAQVGRLEKLVRLHRELAVHTDDLDIVSHLLERVEHLHTELTHLHNRLVFYERAGA